MKGRARPAARGEARLARTPASRALQLPSHCTLAGATGLHALLAAATDVPLSIDGGAVEQVDTAGLQLLVALARRERAAGRTLAWRAASDELRRGGARLGLLGELGLEGGNGVRQ